MSIVKYVDGASISELLDEYRAELPSAFTARLSAILDNGTPLSPQPRGHWIRTERYVVHSNPYMDNYFDRKSICSHCSHVLHVPEKYMWDSVESTACPECGCIMDDGQVEIYNSRTLNR